jgi:hypothetical protein
MIYDSPNPRPAQRRWPWLVAVASLSAFALANLLYPDDEADIVFTGMFSAIMVAFVLVGALLTVRVPGNVVGPLLLGSGAVLATTIAIGTLALVAARSGDNDPRLVAIGAMINDFGFNVPIIVVLIVVPLFFPDGRLLSPRWRWIVALAVAALTSLAVQLVLGPGPIGAPEVPNPFAVPALEQLLAVLDGLVSWTSIIGFSAAALSIVIRYRRGDEVERHQLKWLIAVVTVAAVAFPVAFIAPASPVTDVAFVLGLFALLALPVAIGIAILRYRLYEIDKLISRTIGWTVVSGLLVATFALLVIGLQAVLQGMTQGDTLAVAASTLVAFALFQPVRRTVQRAVDRRFDRARYDAQQTADRFAERLRHEVDLDTLAIELEGTVRGVIRPTAASLWLPGREP